MVIAVGAANPSEIHEIIVTARRQTEPVNQVPLSIRALPGETLVSASIQNLQDIAAHTPGLGYEAQFAAGGGVPTMRGQSPPNAPGNNVAVFVDGVFQAERNAYDNELLDIERVEVINGPQSSMFGHSSFAGAIYYVSKKPTSDNEWGYQLDTGSDDWNGVQGWWSGPLANSGWLGRIATSWRSADGTLSDKSTPSSLGGFERKAISMAISRNVENTDVWNATLRFRHNISEAQHPYVSSISGLDYNCGAIDPATGYWSYYCGHAPISDKFDLSSGLPDSQSVANQASLLLEIPLPGGLHLSSLTSGYRGEAQVVRDFDASSVGLTFGVCTLNLNCPNSGQPDQPVSRLVNINEVQEKDHLTKAYSQEIRIRGSDEKPFKWLIGGIYSYENTRDTTSIGADRVDLDEDELLTTVLPTPPFISRSVSLLNEALVDDSRFEQVVLNRRYARSHTWAVFGEASTMLLKALRLRAEWRYTQERLDLKSVTENFSEGLDSFPAGEFSDFTPRLSIDYSPTEGAMIYASAAKGSRSGGINTIPGLSPEERTYDPEYNWTYELGARYSSEGMVSSLALTLYSIKWRDAQILGFSASPSINNLIIGNTGGIDTKGLEFSMAIEPFKWLRGEFAYSHVDARFIDGSDDPGSGAFCGLSGGNTTSSFCTLGPPRETAPSGITLVPWLDDNRASRTPRDMYVITALINPQKEIRGWKLSLRADLTYQSDMFERSLEHLKFGSRKLFDSRISFSHGSWVIELWGRNLTDERYQRSSFSRGALFFPTSTRPIDFIYGEERRFGVTFRYAH